MTTSLPPCLSVHPVTDGEEISGYEYRCSFCGWAGIGYLTEDGARRDATGHRCQNRRPPWNEVQRKPTT